MDETEQNAPVTVPEVEEPVTMETMTEVEPTAETATESTPPNIGGVETDSPVGVSEATEQPVPSSVTILNSNEPQTVTITEVMEPTAPEPVSRAPLDTKPDQKTLWGRFLEKLYVRKSVRLEKAMALARKKGRVVNDDIEKLLHVSDSTATRYLNELVEQGKLKRSGTPKHSIYELS